MMRSLAITWALLLSGSIYGQNVLPPQMYLMNQSMINPAYAGMHDNAILTAISRGQWMGVDGAPFTHTLVGTSAISHHSAAGFSLVNDGYGINSDTEIKFLYCYRVKMRNSTLSFGLQGGGIFFTEDPSKLDTEVSDDPLVGSARASSLAPSFGFGMMFKSDHLFLGMGIPRISATQVETHGIYSKRMSPIYNLSGGLFIRLLNGLMVKPSFLLSYQDDTLVADLNGQLLVGEKIWLGASLRNLSSAGLNLIYTENIYHFGYSFQLPFDEFKSMSYGTHELMLSIDMKLGKRHIRKKRFF